MSKETNIDMDIEISKDINKDINAIECINVKKAFKSTDKYDGKGKAAVKVALDGINVKIKKNRIYALLGRNGAGKTTLMNCICTKCIQDSGEIKVFGETPYENDKVLENIVFMSDDIDGFDMKSVKAILGFAAGFYKNWNKSLSDKLVAFFEIDIKQAYNALSKGQKTVMGIIIGLCSGCEIVLLDEIYSGLDAVARNNFYKILMEEFENNPRTFILSTHLIEEMTALFTDVVIVHKGRVILNEDMDTLFAKSYKCIGRTEQKALLSGKNVIAKNAVGTMTEFLVYDDLSGVEIKKLEDDGFSVSSLSLQELFIGLTEEAPKEWSE